MGVVLQAEHAQLRSHFLSPGATLFPGDTVLTSRAGILLLQAGDTQFYLRGEASAMLEQADGVVRARVRSGSVGFASSAGPQAELIATGLRVRPRSARPTHAQVSILSANEFTVTAFQGDVEVVGEDLAQVVPAGTAYHVTVASQEQQAPRKRGRRRGLAPFILVLMGTAAAVSIWLALRDNPVSPSGT